MKRIVFAAALTVLAATQAFGFGTVRGVGQNAEHERITRHALACPLIGTTEDCFGAKSLVELAGEDRNFGAVGLPDRGELVPENKAHCDSGDYLDIPGYPRTAADGQAALIACRTFMVAELETAVSDAAKLVQNGALVKSQVAIPCLFVGQIKGRAKCNVIEDFGILLHTSQDFYSHSNWVDQPDPALPVGVDNPPGLGHATRAPWIDLRRSDVPFPPGLITGCFDKPPEKTHCNYGPDKLHRIKHAVVNKDEGTIDPIVLTGTTQRGAIADNFARAVNAAIEDSRDKWATLKERLIATYGAHDGKLMACAITHDDPVTACR